MRDSCSSHLEGYFQFSFLIFKRICRIRIFEFQTLHCNLGWQIKLKTSSFLSKILRMIKLLIYYPPCKDQYFPHPVYELQVIFLKNDTAQSLSNFPTKNIKTHLSLTL